MDIKSKVRALVNEAFFIGQDYQLDDDASFLQEDLADPTGVLEIIMFLESAFEIVVEDEEIVPENLDSVDAITAFVQRKRSAPVAAKAS